MGDIGDVHTLPLEDRDDADLKLTRPWLLLHTPTPDISTLAFAYGTTQATERELQATPLTIQWRRASGRHEHTDFHPARLRTPPPWRAGVRVGHAPQHLRIQAAFRSALGIGEGVRWRGEPEDVGRGRIVRLSAAARRRHDDARYAVIVTRHEYARTRRYQHLLPIYDLGEILPEAGDVVSRAEWTRRLPDAMPEGAIVATGGLFTGSETYRPFVPGPIAGYTRQALDAATMIEVDRALAAMYDLGQPPRA
ncbi:MAG TPA: hypothetical protein VM890_04480 [Longimicrobium sp.]|nr:hypothetical protein [Longimicrobium sp.]